MCAPNANVPAESQVLEREEQMCANRRAGRCCTDCRRRMDDLLAEAEAAVKRTRLDPQPLAAGTN